MNESRAFKPIRDLPPGTLLQAARLVQSALLAHQTAKSLRKSSGRRERSPLRGPLRKLLRQGDKIDAVALLKRHFPNPVLLGVMLVAKTYTPGV